jgi:hypothetical protein
MPKVTDYTQYVNEVNFLKSAHFVSFTATADKDYAHGDVFPSNDGEAKGIVFHETKQGQPVAIIVEGHIYTERLPEAPAQAAQDALKQIAFH